MTVGTFDNVVGSCNIDDILSLRNQLSNVQEQHKDVEHICTQEEIDMQNESLNSNIEEQTNVLPVIRNQQYILRVSKLFT